LEVVVFLLWVSTGFSGSFLARKISQQQKKKLRRTNGRRIKNKNREKREEIKEKREEIREKREEISD
jgi:hypothetical protein